MPADQIKVLFRHRSMEMGGVEKVMLSLLHNLNPEKFALTVCLNLNQGELRDAFPPHVRKVSLTAGREDFSKNKLLRTIQLFQRKQKLERFRRRPYLVDKFYLGEKYDIEIGMTYNDFDSVLNSMNRNSKKIGWFHSEIDLPKLQPLVPNILKNFPRLDAIVYCSEKIREIMHAEYPKLAYPAEQVIINAVSAKEIREKAAETPAFFPGGPVFVSVGRLHTRKGYHKLMEAHARLLADGFPHTVFIIGDGKELPNLRLQQKKLKVEETFIFAGNQMNPYPFMQAADFFIMPSESEAWPLVIAEALVLGKPIIATRVGDVSRMLEDGVTGRLIPYSTDAMYDAMKEFLMDDDLTSKLRNNAAAAAGNFDETAVFKEVEKLFTDLVQPETDLK